MAGIVGHVIREPITAVGRHARRNFADAPRPILFQVVIGIFVIGINACKQSFTSPTKRFRKSAASARCCTGLLTSRVYLDKVQRNILVGPFWPGDERGEQRLGPQGEVLYSSLDQLYRSPLAARFREIEQTYDVGIVYGRRKFVDKETGVTSVPEVLLIDVSRFDKEKIGEFKIRAVEEVRHRLEQVREHLGLRAVHAPGQAGDRGAARAGRDQQQSSRA